MDGYRSETYGDGFADVYDDWYTDLPDPAGCAHHLHRLVGAGPVLELGVGTGRVAVALAAAGTTVVGLDASAAMLGVLRAKMAPTRSGRPSEPAEIAGNAGIAPVRGDMAVLPFGPASVPAVVATFNTLFNLTTEATQRACLGEVARVLRPGGVFVVEAIVAPDPPDRIDDVSVRTIGVDRLVLTASVLDPHAQTITGQHIEITESGNRLRPWVLRYLTTAQLDHLAEDEGLRLEARWSDWEGTPFDPAGHAHVSTFRRT